MHSRRLTMGFTALLIALLLLSICSLSHQSSNAPPSAPDSPQPAAPLTDHPSATDTSQFNECVSPPPVHLHASPSRSGLNLLCGRATSALWKICWRSRRPAPITPFPTVAPPSALPCFEASTKWSFSLPSLVAMSLPQWRAATPLCTWRPRLTSKTSPSFFTCDASSAERLIPSSRSHQRPRAQVPSCSQFHRRRRRLSPRACRRRFRQC